MTNQLRAHLEAEYDKEFSGWDFSYLDGRMEESPLPWNYRLILENHFKNTEILLDMGTGGGEFLDSFTRLPMRTYATEGYAPNIDIARNRLGKRDIIVEEVGEDDRLPFADEYFELICNRHESYKASEVHRILKKGGLFITQQVGGLNDADLNACLGDNNLEYFDWCLVKAMHELEATGFSIQEEKEYLGKTRFYDIGSIVYYLKCIPWQVEDFSVAKYFERLEVMNRILDKEGYIDFINHRFYLIAQKR